MNIYITSGTMDFMEVLRKRHKKETMVAMHSSGNSVLLHETKGKTVFQTPRRYEVVSSSGNITESGFFALNHLSVTDEGRPVFEHLFQDLTDTIADEPGLIAFRLLRPLDSDTYIIMTEWSKELFFDAWKKSPAYEHVHEESKSRVNINRTAHIFSSAPYVTTFVTKNEIEEE